VEPQNPYLTHRVAIEQAIGIVSSRARLSAADAEEFASTVRLHVLKGDCAALRRFKERSSIRTYLVAVVDHCFRDWRNARWGKWRPSAEAKRSGDVGIKLERLLVRDGLTLDEAYETLRTNSGLTIPRAEVDRLVARLPPRSVRRFVSDAVLEHHPSADLPPDARVAETEAASRATEALERLAAAMATLAPRDRLILSMRFWDACSIVTIATALQTEPKMLYRHVDRLLLQLRNSLQAAGLSSEAAAELLRHRGLQSIDVDEFPEATSRRTTSTPDARMSDGPTRP
jgi:RNA polymerase sigma factor (sigma-70 family)